MKTFETCAINNLYINLSLTNPFKNIIKHKFKTKINADLKVTNNDEIAINGDLNIDSYLDYKTQTFESDKDSNGKSVSGSKKKKVAEYISNSNLSSIEKEYLFVQQGYASLPCK